MSNPGVLPPWLVLDPLLRTWLLEDIGRGDRTTNTHIFNLLPSKSTISLVFVIKQ